MQNNKKSAILVVSTSPVGDELFVNANLFFCINNQIWPLSRGYKRSIVAL